MKKIIQALVKTRHALSLHASSMHALSMHALSVIVIAILMMASYTVNAQVAINTDGSNADPSAMLDVKSTNKGMLIPRVALSGTTDANTISSPAVSLLVYNTATAGDVTPGFYYWDGTAWAAIPRTYHVGDFAQGGIVFWVDETGQHGLVCAKTDQNGGSKIQWYNGSNTYTEAIGDGVYAGEMNTMLIIANQGHNSNDYAAGVCANYKVTESGVTYGDWYLPSKEELNLMYQNKATIDATATAHGGSDFTNDWYWSSTEDGSKFADLQEFDYGSQGDNVKYNTQRVRAVRAF